MTAKSKEDPCTKEKLQQNPSLQWPTTTATTTTTTTNVDGRLRKRRVHGAFNAVKAVTRHFDYGHRHTTTPKAIVPEKCVGKDRTSSLEKDDDITDPEKNKSNDDNIPTEVPCSVENESSHHINTNCCSDENKIIDQSSVVHDVSLVEIFTTDSILFGWLCFAIAGGVTIQYWMEVSSSTTGSTVPSVVVGSWILLAYALGQVMGLFIGETHLWMSFMKTKNTVEPHSDTSLSMERNVENRNEIRMQESKAKKHQFISSLLGSSSKVRLTGGSRSNKLPNPMSWTTLKMRNSLSQYNLLPWQLNIDPCQDKTNNFLVRNLLKHTEVRRRRKYVPQYDTDPTQKSFIDQVDNGINDPLQDNLHPSLGAFDLTTAIADSLDDCITVKPLLELRGMDVLLTDDPETDVGTHPWLISKGLRNVPTLVINVLTQWGNILIYFKLPEHLFSDKGSDRTMDNLKENENDADDIKAIKRFLSRDDDYRNERLKMIPSLVDGPAPIRLVAPPKKEKVVHCNYLPIYWKRHQGDGLQPILIATLDCMSNRAMRSMASLVKRYLSSLSVDVAIMIGKPNNQEEPEPSACLGMWRFDHIDVSLCPKLPDRFESEAKKCGKTPGILRASCILGLSTTDLIDLDTQE